MKYKTIYLLTIMMALLVFMGGCAHGTDSGTAVGESTSNAAKETSAAEDSAAFFQHLAGNWRLDFHRTDSSLFGTGIQYGNHMGISQDGELDYFIGISAGGTGQCAAQENGIFTVAIEPYERHSSEQEILTLEYCNSDGNESIQMTWHEETLYWVREREPNPATPSDESEPSRTSDADS